MIRTVMTLPTHIEAILTDYHSHSSCTHICLKMLTTMRLVVTEKGEEKKKLIASPSRQHIKSEWTARSDTHPGTISTCDAGMTPSTFRPCSVYLCRGSAAGSAWYAVSASVSLELSCVSIVQR